MIWSMSSDNPLKLSGQKLLYLFSKSINWLDFDPSYTKEPKALGNYIGKYRKEKGLLIKAFAGLLGVTKETVINGEVREIKPKGQNMKLLNSIMPIS